MIYRTCPYCGASLDPCERCDCQDKKEAATALQRNDGKGRNIHTSACYASQDTEN